MAEKDQVPKLEEILDKCWQGKPLSTPEITYLLGIKEGHKISRVFQAAQHIRARHFGNKIFLYGFVYFSTFCRNNCTFCSSRTSNKLARRYRKREEEIVEAASLLSESGVHLIDLTMGEDPYYSKNEDGFHLLLGLIQKVKMETGLPLMLSPGVVPRDVLVDFAKAGVDWYACYQETHNRQLFVYLRPEQSYDSRFLSKIYAQQSGILIEEGIMTGVGEKCSDIAFSTEVIRTLGAQQARVMSFVPQIGTPMSDRKSPSRLRELMTIAVFRLLFPDRLIPASLDVDGLDLLQERLEAGANVVTSLIPPRLGLSGVSQPYLGIDEGSRTVQGVTSLIDKMGMAVATNEDYLQWVYAEKSALIHGPTNYEVAV